jgi:hypothetical protein
MHPARYRSVLKERTNLRTVLVASIVALIGVGMLVLADNNGIWGMNNTNASFPSVIRDVGGLLVASVAVALLWELFGKRAFFEELWEKIRLAEDIREAGIIQFTKDFSDVDWDPLFENVKEIDIFFIYGRTWRRLYGNRLIEAATRQAKIRVILPDPQDKTIISEFDRRFTNISRDAIRELILEAKSEFELLRKKGAQVSIWYISAIPLYSFYRFDNIIVWSVYHHQRDIHSTVPAFILSKDGSLYHFVKEDFEATIQDTTGLVKLV